MNRFSDLTKYAIPAVFAILALVLIVQSTKVTTVENAVCFKDEFDPAAARLITLDDLGEEYKPTVKEYRSLLVKIADNKDTLGKLKDTTNKIIEVLSDYINNPLKLEDSLRYDSIKQANVKVIKEFRDMDSTLVMQNYNNERELDKAMKEINFLRVLNADIQTVESKQNTMFLIGGIGLLIISIVMALFIANVISRQLTFILIPIFLIGAIAYLYVIWNEVDTIDDHTTNRNEVYEETKQRMEDIKYAVLQFKEQKKRVPIDMDEVIEFVKTGKAMSVYSKGQVPGTKIDPAHAYMLWSGMYEKGDDTSSVEFKESMKTWLDTTVITYGDSSYNVYRAWKLDMIVRDTTFIPVMEKLYTGPEAPTRFSKQAFDADSLRYMAYSKEELVYRDTAVVVSVGDDGKAKFKHRFEVRLRRPMLIYNTDHKCERRQELIMGSLYEDKFSGNW